MFVTKRNGQLEALDTAKYNKYIDWLCSGTQNVSSKQLKTRASQLFYDKMSTKDICLHTITIAGELISPESPNWTYVASRAIVFELLKTVSESNEYPTLSEYLTLAVSKEKIDPGLLSHFDIESLQDAIVEDRDYNFDYLGIQTLADRYLVKVDNKVIELPQHLFMRVAMGQCLAEPKETATAHAINLYNQYSTLKGLSSTPTLFNSGTLYPQLSSCFGTVMADSHAGIYSAAAETSLYSKFSGGCALDVTDIRSSGSYIKSTGGKAGGPIPYIKLYEDGLIGFDQSGKRKGAGVVYMETWHANIKDFLKLRDPGDHRLRAHDTFTANWIPDLFMKRVASGEYWSLFDPKEVSDLHSLYGDEFETKYIQYEAKGLAKEIIDAQDLWYSILTAVSKHGVFWPSFKDTINKRYAQSKTGVVKTSNLCLTGDTLVKVIRNGVLGEETLKELVANYSGVRALSYNSISNTSEFKTVTNGALMSKGARLIRVTDKDTSVSIRCTPEHKVWTENRGYVRAKDLLPSDTLRIG